jgi:RNA polymerase sigma-70 factor
MPKDSTLASLHQFLAQHSQLTGELHSEALCARWGLSQEVFAEGLRRSAEKRFGCVPADPGDVEAYLKSLHLEDLALACACSEGIEKAWEFFIAHFRQDLRHAVRAMLRGSGLADEARAEELADSLYAELYGVRAKGERKSLFDYFHGRSKLATWLRAVLAQKQVDLFRTSGRTVSLESEVRVDASREIAAPVRPALAEPDPHRESYLGRFEQALAVALANLTPRERMILACYYLDRLTLAEVGKMLREHESTVSRQLERLRRLLRENVTQVLRREVPASDGRPAEPALDVAQVELTFEYALEESRFDLSQALSAAEPATDLPEDRGTKRLMENSG